MTASSLERPVLNGGPYNEQAQHQCLSLSSRRDLQSVEIKKLDGRWTLSNYGVRVGSMVTYCPFCGAYLETGIRRDG
jgi:hypothetical protein